MGELAIDAPPTRMEPEPVVFDLPVRATMAWLTGAVASWAWPMAPGWWFGLAFACVLAGYAGWRRWTSALPSKTHERARWMALATLACLAAAWTRLHAAYVPADHVTRFLPPEPVLATLAGAIEGAVETVPQQRGAMGERFGWQDPATMFVLSLDGYRREAGAGDPGGEPRWTPLSGRVLVKIKRADHHLRPGQRIAATGWFEGIEPPTAPGQFDHRAMLAQRDIHARLSLAGPENWALLNEGTLVGQMDALRHRWSDALAASLRLGMPQEEQRLGLLDMLLLGRRNRDVYGIAESFRKTGLTHLLAISGGHLSALLALGWMLASLPAQHPRRTAGAMLVLLAAYLFATPWNPPILRAGVMAGLFCLAQMSGRRWRGTTLMSLACLTTLAVDPLAWMDAGFQLSYGVVAALLLYTRPLAEAIWPPPAVQLASPPWWLVPARWGVEFLAANIVAFLVTMPLTAYHFQFISPLCVPLGMIALSLCSALLGLGFFKIVAGLLWPSVGMALAPPTAWLADSLIGWVEHGARWSWAGLDLGRAPSLTWTLATLAGALALLSGRYRQRPWSAVATAMLLVAWIAWIPGGRPKSIWQDDSPPGPGMNSATALAPPSRVASKPLSHEPDDAQAFAPSAQAPAPPSAAWPGGPPELRIYMLPVGDGSCYLLRIAGDPTLTGEDAQPRDVMFDCGSQAHMDLGYQSIAPALRHLGVRRLDALIVSHPDTDHYCGALDVLDKIPIRRIHAPPVLLSEAHALPRGPTAFLVDGLAERGLRVEPIERGWRRRWGRVAIEALWPAADFKAPRSNSHSTVLRLSALPLGAPSPWDAPPSPASRPIRAMLCGDAENFALFGVLRLETAQALRADVLEMPHHGSVVDATPRFFQVLAPRLLLQSTGPARLSLDKWAPLLQGGPGPLRLISERQGMVETALYADGRVYWRSMRHPAWSPAPASPRP